MMGRAGARSVTAQVPDDDATLADAASRDRQAFVMLYDRYVDSVERYVAARSDSADVEDLVSTTFMRALTRIQTYRAERGSFAGWLFTIARHVVVDQYRERSRFAFLQSSAPQPGGELGPEALTLAREEGRRVRAALAELTPEQRDALALRYAADLPFAAVAAALGKSEPAAKMLVQRGLQALRRDLQKDQTHD